LSFEFEIKYLGEAKKVLGMETERDRDTNIKGTSEVQYQWWYEVCKYNVGSSHQA